MNKFRRTSIHWLPALAGLGCVAVAQNSNTGPADLVNTISQRYQEAKQYSFEGDLEISRRSGTEKPKEVLLKARVRFLAASPGKYLLRAEKPSSPSYMIVSDGQKTWAYVPALKRYTEREASGSARQVDPEAGLDVQSNGKGDLADEFCQLVVPILAGLAKSVEVTDLRGSLLSVLSKRDATGRQNMTYLTLDTATLDIKRISWMNASPADNGDKVLMRSDLTLATFRIGGSISDADFTFQPPKDAKRVGSLPATTGRATTSKGRSLR
jgi:outer membrane lipoprotein-sorting protein